MKNPRNILVFNQDGVTIEGHVIGAEKIILGDLRSKGVIQINGEDVDFTQNSGRLLFDRKNDGANRAWFVLDFEKGGRLKVRNTDET